MATKKAHVKKLDKVEKTASAKSAPVSLIEDLEDVVELFDVVSDCLFYIAQDLKKGKGKPPAKKPPKKGECPACASKKPPKPAKKPELSGKEKHEIVILRKKGYTIKAAAKAIHRKEKVVADFVHRVEGKA